jgi:hypothetical protein
MDQLGGYSIGSFFVGLYAREANLLKTKGKQRRGILRSVTKPGLGVGKWGSRARQNCPIQSSDFPTLNTIVNQLYKISIVVAHTVRGGVKRVSGLCLMDTRHLLLFEPNHHSFFSFPLSLRLSPDTVAASTLDLPRALLPLNMQRSHLGPAHTTPMGKKTRAAEQITPEEAHSRIHNKVYSYIASRNLTGPYGLYLTEMTSKVGGISSPLTA